MKYWPYLSIVVTLPILLLAYLIVLGYTPWSNTLITLPPETEILLFTVQAGIGTVIIGHFFGFRKGEKTKKTSLGPEFKQKQKIDLKFLLLIGAVIVIFVVPFVINSGAEFGGTDGQGPDAIESSGYTPWIEPMGLQPDELGEIVFLSFQVAIGAAIIGYFIGYTRAKGH